MRRSCMITVICLTAFVLPAWADFAAGVAAYQKGDYATAFKEFQDEATNGNAAAQYNLGMLYYDGKGTPQDYSEAAVWLRRAAEQGYAEAQHNFGALLASGQGVKRDYEQAYVWMSLCAAQDNKGCIEQRDLLAQKLSKSKLQRAQRRAREWQPLKSDQTKPQAQ